VPTLAGIFILAEITGPVADEIHAVNQRYDPKLAAGRRPHVTMAGSSGVGPISVNTTVAELKESLTPVAASSAPISVTLGAPHRFIPTDIVVLPIDPHGPIRELHDKIARTGLHFGHARFTFSPHITLNLYRTLTPESLRALMKLHIPGPVTIDSLQVYRTQEPNPARLLFELPLTGGVLANALPPRSVPLR
jgi:2'-5' RNA ligase